MDYGYDYLREDEQEDDDEEETSVAVEIAEEGA